MFLRRSPPPVRLATAMLHASLLDDRGKRVHLVDYTESVRAGADPQRNARIKAVVSGKQPPPTAREIRQGVIYGLIALPVMLVAALAPAYIAFNTGLPWWGKVLAAVPMGLLPSMVTIALVRRIAAARIARGYTRAGYCAGCAYDLAATPAAADGCRVCPECGAAWAIRQEQERPLE